MSFHQKINTSLTCTVVVLGLYICLYPFAPQVDWWWRHRQPSHATMPSPQPASAESTLPIPDNNLLVIPRLDMREAIHSGTSLAELNKGAWLIPNSARPSEIGNTVIVGHRFGYSGVGVFYFLDKVQLDDTITVNWERAEYTYRVAAIKTVPPTDISVEAPTAKPQLTLYTCTPLWNAKNRLVVTASLEGVRR